MEERPQSQSPDPRPASAGRDPEAEARRLLAEFERESLARRSRLASPGARSTLRALGLAILLALGLGVAWLLLHATSVLPRLLEGGR